MIKKIALIAVPMLIMAAVGYSVYWLIYQPELNLKFPFFNSQKSSDLESESNIPSGGQNPDIQEINKTEKEETSVKVVFPNGGEDWKMGSTHTIAWQSSGVESLDIILENWDAVEGNWPASILIARNVPAALKEYSFDLSAAKLPPDAPKDGDNFKIRIVPYPLDYTISDRSDDFFSIRQ